MLLNLQKLLRGIRHFKKHSYQEKQTIFKALSQGQAPDVLFVTCSDSRIDPHLFTHAELGELFVLRNAGNIIAPISSTPSGEAATIEFALVQLNIQDIIICGHSDCGAMKGLLAPDLDKTLPQVDAWLTHSRTALNRLQKIAETTQSKQPINLLQLTQENILLQMEHLKTHPTVKKKMAEGNLRIHGWYYEFETGEVYLYNELEHKFIAFEQTVIDLLDKVLYRIIDLVALNHITQAYHAENDPKHTNFKKILHEIKKSNNIQPIWNEIQSAVSQAIDNEMNGLFNSEQDTAQHRKECLEKSPNIKLQDLPKLHKVINKVLIEFNLQSTNMSFFPNSKPSSAPPSDSPQLIAHL